MPGPGEDPLDLTVLPLTLERWQDLESLFGPSGAYAGCWCMWWRITRRQFSHDSGEGNRRSLRSIVESGRVPGVLAYLGETPIGWCSLGPRTEYGSLERSPVLKRLDEQPVWSIVCFFIDRAWRGQGHCRQVLRGAIAYAQGQGAEILEAYPTAPRGKRLDSVSSFMGLPSVYEAEGFVERARPSKSRIVLRKHLRESGSS